MQFFRDVICELYLGAPSQWGPRRFGEGILDLFWSERLRFAERFRLTLFVQNNPLPRHVFHVVNPQQYAERQGSIRTCE